MAMWGITLYSIVTMVTLPKHQVIISVVQTVIILPVVFYYVTTVIKFNKSHILPDMERYLKESASPIQIQVGLSRSVKRAASYIN